VFYELTVLLDPRTDSDDDLYKGILKRIDDYIKDNNFEIIKTECLGLKRLAYPISDKNMAVYQNYHIKTGKDHKAGSLSNDLSLDTGCLRSLLVCYGNDYAALKD